MAQKKDIVLLKKVATALKELRARHNLTQADVFYDTGIHIGRIESYKVNLSLSTLFFLCEYYDISLVEFFRMISDQSNLE